MKDTRIIKMITNTVEETKKNIETLEKQIKLAQKKMVEKELTDFDSNLTEMLNLVKNFSESIEEQTEIITERARD